MSETTNEKYVSRAGEFLCEVKNPGNGWFGESSEKLTPFIRISVVVVEDCDQKGREITWSGWLSDAAFDRTIETLCKVFPTWDGNLNALESGEFGFQGGRCRIVVEMESYTNDKGITKQSAKAKWLNPVDGGGNGGAVMAKDKVSSLVAKLGRKAMAIAKSVKAESPAASSSALTDDIPMGDSKEKGLF